MPKFKIFWDAGYGESSEVVEAESEIHADNLAFERWKEEADSNSNYWSEPYEEESDES